MLSVPLSLCLCLFPFQLQIQLWIFAHDTYKTAAWILDLECKGWGGGGGWVWISSTEGDAVRLSDINKPETNISETLNDNNCLLYNQFNIY